MSPRSYTPEQVIATSIPLDKKKLLGYRATQKSIKQIAKIFSCCLSKYRRDSFMSTDNDILSEQSWVLRDSPVSRGFQAEIIIANPKSLRMLLPYFTE